MSTSETAVKRRPKSKGRKAYETLSVGSVGLEMGVAVLLGWGVGFYLDRELHTGPYLMVICLLFGVAAGFNGLFRVARQAKAITEESDQ